MPKKIVVVSSPCWFREHETDCRFPSLTGISKCKLIKSSHKCSFGLEMSKWAECADVDTGYMSRYVPKTGFQIAYEEVDDTEQLLEE